MTIADQIQQLTKLLKEVTWCRPIEPLINIAPIGREVEAIKRQEDKIRIKILPLLHELEHNAFEVLNNCFSLKVQRPLAPEVQMFKSQYAERCAWGISEIAQYLDSSYQDQIEELLARSPQGHRKSIKSYLERAIDRLP